MAVSSAVASMGGGVYTWAVGGRSPRLGPGRPGPDAPPEQESDPRIR